MTAVGTVLREAKKIPILKSRNGAPEGLSARSLGVDLPAHLKAAADCAGGSALFMRRLAQWRVLRRLRVRVAFVTTCANSAVQSA